MKTALWLAASLLLCTAASAAVPSSIDNDDSCDIKVGPAATLLLPYFAVDVSGTTGQTTLFTITNVSHYPQIAHVTLWTDGAYPVLTFNLFLTGYDVQAINLADVLVRGVVAPPNGTASATTPGALSTSSSGNLRASLDCSANPGQLPLSIVRAITNALTTGQYAPDSCIGAGNIHALAIGYATIDVVASCTARSPADPAYYTNDLLFDNVLIADYQQIGAYPGDRLPGAFDAAGNPMVHIRAVPEGGGAGSSVATALPYTFYDRYTPSGTRTIDRRQPLPSAFAARFIRGGTSAFATNFTIWREGFGKGSCADATASARMPVGEFICFDEHENASVFDSPLCGTCHPNQPMLPAASSNEESNNSFFPPEYGADVGGWMYLNLNNGGSTTYSVTHEVNGVPVPTNGRTSLSPAGSTTTVGPRPSQNWVTISLFGGIGVNQLTAELDAAPLANGCSASVAVNGGVAPGPPIGPAGGVFVCPPGTTLTNGTTALCTGTNVNPNP